MLSHRTKTIIRRIVLALMQVPLLAMALTSRAILWGAAAGFLTSMEYFRLWQLHYVALFATVAAGIATSIWYTRTMYRVTFTAACVAALAGVLLLAIPWIPVPLCLWVLTSFLYFSILYRCRPTEQAEPTVGLGPQP